MLEKSISSGERWVETRFSSYFVIKVRMSMPAAAAVSLCALAHLYKDLLHLTFTPAMLVTATKFDGWW